MSFSNSPAIDSGAFAYFAVYMELIFAEYKAKNTPATPIPVVISPRDKAKSMDDGTKEKTSFNSTEELMNVMKK